MKLYKDEIRDVYEALRAYLHLVSSKNVPYDVIATYKMKMGSLTRIINRFKEYNKL